MGLLRPVIEAVISAVMQTATCSKNVRPYIPADRCGCVNVFDWNVPEFSSRQNGMTLSAFLISKQSPCHIKSSKVRGELSRAGGLAVASDGICAGLCWGMVAEDLHDTGLGKLLTTIRLEAARAISGVEQVRLDTSQHTQGFYRRFGFGGGGSTGWLRSWFRSVGHAAAALSFAHRLTS
jgi:hypothetical protein